MALLDANTESQQHNKTTMERTESELPSPFLDATVEEETTCRALSSVLSNHLFSTVELFQLKPLKKECGEPLPLYSAIASGAVNKSLVASLLEDFLLRICCCKPITVKKERVITLQTMVLGVMTMLKFDQLSNPVHQNDTSITCQRVVQHYSNFFHFKNVLYVCIVLATKMHEDTAFGKPAKYWSLRFKKSGDRLSEQNLNILERSVFRCCNFNIFFTRDDFAHFCSAELALSKDLICSMSSESSLTVPILTESIDSSTPVSSTSNLESNSSNFSSGERTGETLDNKLLNKVIRTERYITYAACTTLSNNYQQSDDRTSSAEVDNN